MTDVGSERTNKLLVDLQVRRKALELLRTHGYRAIEDIERIFGWERPIRMPAHRMAQLLGITKNQLRYLLFRTELKKKAKESRRAKKEARNVLFTTYTSNRFKFTISYPSDWRVSADTLWSEGNDINPEQFNVIIQKGPMASGLNIDHTEERIDAQKAKKEIPAEYSFPKLKEYHEWLLQRQKQKDEDEAELHRMELGLFTISSSNSDDFPSIDIVKLGLTKPLTAFELYEMDKPLSEHVLTGNRSKWGIDVDGLHGEKYYYIPAIHDNWLPKFLNVYLTVGNDGWIISCSCKADVFDHYKPVFERIINSFQRV